MTDWEKIGWRDLEIRRIVRSPIDWVPHTPEMRRSWDLCGWYVHMLEPNNYMSPRQLMLNMSQYCEQHHDAPTMPTMAEFWSNLMIALTYGWIDVKLRDPREPPREVDDAEMEWDGTDSLNEWR